MCCCTLASQLPLVFDTRKTNHRCINAQGKLSSSKLHSFGIRITVLLGGTSTCIQALQNISFVCTKLWSLWQTFKNSHYLDIVLAYTKDISKNLWGLPAKDLVTLSLEITWTYSIHYITLQYGPYFFTQCKDIWWFSSQISDWHCVINVNISLWLSVLKELSKQKKDGDKDCWWSARVVCNYVWTRLLQTCALHSVCEAHIFYFKYVLNRANLH